LQETTRKFLEKLAEMRAADEESYQKRLAQLEADFLERTEELRLKREDLERIREEMHDREPQHERRRLRENLTGDIKSLLENPPKSEFLRKNYTYLSFVAAGIVLITISLFLTSDLARLMPGYTGDSVVPNAAFLIQAIKSLAAGAGGGAFLWAGLNGMKKSEELSRQISDGMQRYSHDMDRASWVVETLLQLNAVESAQVPDTWLEAVCNDLFTDASGTRSNQPDSLEALGALLDATARAKIGTDGFQFELERSQARKLAKSVS
jgi:hypothetical protein